MVGECCQNVSVAKSVILLLEDQPLLPLVQSRNQKMKPRSPLLAEPFFLALPISPDSFRFIPPFADLHARWPGAWLKSPKLGTACKLEHAMLLPIGQYKKMSVVSDTVYGSFDPSTSHSETS